VVTLIWRWATATQRQQNFRNFIDRLTLWKDADSDIPILIAAEAEYAKLK
jgi:hypothetical protein